MATLKMDHVAMIRATQFYLNTLNIGNNLMNVSKVTAVDDAKYPFRVECEVQANTRQELPLILED